MAGNITESGGHLCAVGVQWGDEGKGKIVDVLGSKFDAVVRYQGGANAGHTILIGEEEFIFHLVPSGIIQPDKLCIIGNGVVIDLRTLVEELEGLRQRGIDHEKNLWISDRAHLVLPYHTLLDRLREVRSENGNGTKIGTTLRGIGPCYSDKAARQGIRIADLMDFRQFESLLRRNLEVLNRDLAAVYSEPAIDPQPILEEYRGYRDRIADRVCNITDLLWDLDAANRTILFEGAQGALLDLDLGTYPYVTSSHTSFLGLGAGTGFSPRRVSTVLGITKAYTTRVGEGPFPTEQEGDIGEFLRQAGGEFGATTGRPRRCGWLDLFALRYSIRFGDVDALALTKLDVLNDFDTLKVCTGYKGIGEISGRGTGFPVDLHCDLQPQYRELPGWKKPISSCRRFEDLPEATRNYLRFIAEVTECPIAMLSVGKERSQTILLDPWLAPKR